MEEAAMIGPMDPLAVAFAWGLTFLVKKVFKDKPKIKHLLPMIAVLMATAVYAIVGTVSGEPLSWELVWRGLAAGGVAVTGHSQFREFLKASAKPPGSVLSGTDPGTSNR